MSIASATIIGGMSHAHRRNAADFYPTPPECTWALLRHFNPPGPVWEPACGDGAISKELKASGLSVFSTDLHDRGYGLAGMDFLNRVGAEFRSIVTNPPFSLAEQFIRRARSFGVPFAMLLKSTYWHAAGRQELFGNTGPEQVIAMTWRPAFDTSRGKSPTMDVIWTTWGAEPSDICVYKTAAKPHMGIFT